MKKWKVKKINDYPEIWTDEKKQTNYVIGFVFFLAIVGILFLIFLKSALPKKEKIKIPRLPQPEEVITKANVIIAEITAYNPIEGQTDSSPMIMASGKRVYKGAIACPGWLPFGKQVEIGEKIYVCEDRMALRYRNSVNPAYFDILSFSKKDAIMWGRRVLMIKILKNEKDR